MAQQGTVEVGKASISLVGTNDPFRDDIPPAPWNLTMSGADHRFP
jgi:hypothetical protein